MNAIEKIEALALQVAEQAAGPATLELRIAALKALSPYYGLLTKGRPVVEDSEYSMEHLAEQINEADNDGQRVQAGAGRRNGTVVSGQDGV